MEKRIFYLSERIRLLQELKDMEDEIIASTEDLASDETFAAGDLPGVDEHLLQRINDLMLRKTQQERTLEFLSSVEKTLRDPDTECAVCFEGLQDQEISLLQCMHPFCFACVQRLFGTANEATCPMCRTKAQKRNISTFLCTNTPPPQASQASAGPTAFYGSKIAALVTSIQKILTTTDEKMVVFGQWASLLFDVKRALENLRIHTLLLSDVMALRCEQLDEFRDNPDSRILLLSSESQSSGINLDHANHVFIIHPYVPHGAVSASVVPLLESQAFEKQAVGRVHRYPQSKDVHVYRLYARGSVEEELYSLCGYI